VQLKIKDVVWQEGEHFVADEEARSVVSQDTKEQKIQVCVLISLRVNHRDPLQQVYLPSVGGERTERILSSFQNLGFGEPGSHTSLWYNIIPPALACLLLSNCLCPGSCQWCFGCQRRPLKRRAMTSFALASRSLRCAG
jgi:hypothetical protein